jgi:hypothetical protein
MAKALLNLKIKKAMEEHYPMYWVRIGLHGLQLRAVTYTFENGTSRTMKLDEFDIKIDLQQALRVHMEICKLVSLNYAPDILPSLNNAFWQGELECSPEALFKEYQSNIEAG